MPTDTELSTAFVDYLKEQGLYNLLPTIVEKLRQELYRNQDITVISAENLKKDEETQITQQLKDKWGEHRIIFSTDPSILSGLIIRFADTVINTSGKHKLTSLAEELTS